MNKKLIIKMCADIAMTVVLMFLMAYSLVGTDKHEYLGIGMFALLVIHHLLNMNWNKNIVKGKYTAFRIAQTLVSVLILCSVLGSMFSGIVMSRFVFKSLEIPFSPATARTMHMICAYWGFVLMSVHLGFHWQMMMGMGKRMFKKKSAVRTWIVRCMGIAIAGYGGYAMYKRNYLDYLLLKNPFVFFDFSEKLIFFMLDYVAIMGLFVFIGHYTAKALHRIGKERRSE